LPLPLHNAQCRIHNGGGRIKAVRSESKCSEMNRGGER
jgi:hypothetical protein